MSQVVPARHGLFSQKFIGCTCPLHSTPSFDSTASRHPHHLLHHSNHIHFPVLICSIASSHSIASSQSTAARCTELCSKISGSLAPTHVMEATCSWKTPGSMPHSLERPRTDSFDCSGRFIEQRMHSLRRSQPASVGFTGRFQSFHLSFRT